MWCSGQHTCLSSSFWGEVRTQPGFEKFSRDSRLGNYSFCPPAGRWQARGVGPHTRWPRGDSLKGVIDGRRACLKVKELAMCRRRGRRDSRSMRMQWPALSTGDSHPRLRGRRGLLRATSAAQHATVPSKPRARARAPSCVSVCCSSVVEPGRALAHPLTVSGCAPTMVRERRRRRGQRRGNGGRSGVSAAATRSRRRGPRGAPP